MKNDKTAERGARKVPPIPGWAEYEVCRGCHKPTEDVPAVYLPALKGRDCGCPCGTAMRLRKPEHPPTPPADLLAVAKIRTWAQKRYDDAAKTFNEVKQRGDFCDWADDQMYQMEDLMKYLDTLAPTPPAERGEEKNDE